MIFGYAGLASGDLSACLLSQSLKSRRKALLLFLGCNALLCFYYLFVSHPNSPVLFKMFYFLLGFTAGYWALMALIAAESFGTNLRATVATSVPNIARAAAIPIGIALSYLKEPFGLIPAALIVSVIVFIIGILSAFLIRETYGLDLNYNET
jgi:MFS transporter, putative metabolite:H+ symporter